MISTEEKFISFALSAQQADIMMSPVDTFRGPQGEKGDPGTLTGIAEDSLRLGGLLPQAYRQAANLLDNSDFVRPVNQRGQTAYTGGVGVATGYTIDRWYISKANAVLTLVPAGIRVDNTANASATCILNQRLTLPPAGVYTLAVMSDAGLICRCYAFDGTALRQQYQSAEPAQASAWLTISSGLLLTQIVTRARQTVAYQWAALLPGSYTAESLPPYIPKGYAAELTACQRYFRRLQVSSGHLLAAAYSAVMARLFLPCGMRIPRPSVAFGAGMQLWDPALSQRYGITNITAACGNDGGLSLTVESDGLTPGKVYSLYAGTNALSLDLSADL